jgi:protein-tyrosine phosphatase
MIRTAIAFSALLLATPLWAEQAAPAAHDHAAPSAADRFVVLEGGRNFRDVGGYKTADGRVVKSGVMYRSGSLGKLTPAGQARLASLHITDEIDLRTPEERSHDTFNLPAAIGPGYWTRDYGLDRAAMGTMPDPATLTRDKVAAMMGGAYRGLAQMQTPAYRELFARLQTAKGPLVLNCTAGKDRTGIGTALVLTALGVPYETVKQDFLLSNGAPGMDTLQTDLSAMFAKLPADVVAPMIGVEGAYLDSAFAQLREQYGSVEGYMQKELGVGPKEIAALRKRMLK